jgi:hypothetical protein
VTHFEYISVAIALISALSVGRLLGGLPSALDRGRRYWVHVAWILTLFLVVILQWWLLWNAKQVAWTPIRFLWVLSFPGVHFLQAVVLVGDNPSSVASYRDHFFHLRIPFFSLSLVTGVFTAANHWVLSDAPLFTFVPNHRIATVLTALSIAALCSKSPNVHAALV